MIDDIEEQEGINEGLKILADPLKFAEICLNFPIYDYNKKFLTDQSKRIIFKGGRKVGKSSMAAIKCLHFALSEVNKEIIIVAPTQRQAMILFWKIKEFIHNSPFISLITRETQTMLFLKTGCRIISLPSGYTSQNIRGFTPSIIIIDEGGYVPDDAYIALEPSIATTNGQMILIGTPFGKRGRFFTAWNDNDFSKYEVLSKQNPLITDKFLEGVRNDGSMTESEYLQEFEAQFVEESSTYFSHSLILSALIRSEVKGDRRDDRKYFLGVDIARYGRDATVYVTLEMSEGGRGRIIRIDEDTKKPITHVVGRVLDLNNIYGYEKIFVDETSLGGGGIDMLQEKLDNVEGITFSLVRKSELYKNLKILLEKGRLHFINNDKLINQLMALIYEYTSQGQLKIHAPERIHDDVPDACVLACMGFENELSAVALEVPDDAGTLSEAFR